MYDKETMQLFLSIMFRRLDVLCKNLEFSDNKKLMSRWGMSNNQLITLPESFGNLIDLGWVDLDHNQLISLPLNWCESISTNNPGIIPDIITVKYNQLCEEYHYDCIDVWEPQDCDD